MQSSVSSHPPRLGEIPRTFSNDSVHVSQEVSVVSSRAPFPQMPKTIYSPLPPSTLPRPQTSVTSIPLGASVTSIARYSSLSRELEKGHSYTNRTSMRRASLMGDELLESNRESMKALSDFLMTREPPPNNWMSNQSSEDGKSLSGFKRSAYKLFGKSKKKISKTPRLMQLPDSAVAARTSRGSRHIAISIPLIHDRPNGTNRPPTPTPAIAKEADMPRERTDRTAVHVLKPLTEVRESIYLSSPPRSRNGLIEETQKELKINPLAVHPPAEFLRQSPTLGQNAGTYLNYRPEPRIEPRNSYKHDPNKRKSYVAVAPMAMQRQDSQKSDPRHSGGTVYSTFTTATPQAGDSRQPSNVSTAASSHAPGATVITGLKLDLPPRSSSMSKLPTSLQAELAQSSRLLNDKSQESPLAPIRAGSGSVGSSATSNSPPPNVVVGTAETARTYSAGKMEGPQLVRSNTPMSQISGISGPPNKSLPELPPGATRSTPRPATAPPAQNRRSAAISQTIEMTRRSASTKETDVTSARKIDPTLSPRQSRQERVKERKQRDIDTLRSSSKLNQRAPLSESSSNPDLIPPIVVTGTPSSPRATTLVTSPRNPKRAGLSSTGRRRLANSLTPIMLVADLAPYSGYVTHSDFSSRAGRHRAVQSASAIRPMQSATDLKRVARDFGRLRENRSASDPPFSPTTLDKFPTVPTHHSNRSSISRSARHRQVSTSPPLSNRSRESPTPRASSPTTGGARGRTHSQSLRSSVLETRRQERRAKRNLSLREQELDARLKKIERDNAILLRTLGGIARSFGQLGGFSGLRNFGAGGLDGEDSPQSFGDVGSEASWIRGEGCERGGERERERDERARRGELRGMEPVMRELQGLAPRVSKESLALEDCGAVHAVRAH